MIDIAVARPSDFKAYFKIDPPDIFTALVGRKNGRILGMGGVIYDELGRAFAFFDALVRPSFTVHRHAIRFLDAMRQVGEPAIYTTCDPDVSARAEAWLIRLGFEKDDAMSTDEAVIWKWVP